MVRSPACIVFIFALSVLFLSTIGQALTLPQPSPICKCPTDKRLVCCTLKTGITKLLSGSCTCTKCYHGKITSLSSCIRHIPCRCPLFKTGTTKPETLPDPTPIPLPVPILLRPVCCLFKSGARMVVRSNCDCTCRGGRVIPLGKCPVPVPSPCICPLIYAPVCCKLPSGHLVTKSNSCGCGCVKGKVVKKGACSVPATCICPDVLDPVCCKLPSGKVQTKSNSCRCRCDKGTVISKGQCLLTA